MPRKLFDDGTSYWPYNAVLNYSDKGYAYISGYKDAADELVTAITDRRATLDTLCLSYLLPLPTLPCAVAKGDDLASRDVFRKVGL
jgi:hypothetical protein